MFSPSRSWPFSPGRPWPLRRGLTRAVAAALVASSIGLIAPTAPSLGRSPQAELAFVNGQELRVVAPDGKGERTVAWSDDTIAPVTWSWLLDPAWSPDGSRLAYAETTGASWTSLKSELGVARAADGVNGAPLATFSGGVIQNVRWSPDGSRLAFVLWTPNPAGIVTWSHAGSRWDVYTVNADGSGLRPLAPAHPSFVNSLDFSPDGSKLAFVSDQQGVTGVYTLSLDDLLPPIRVSPSDVEVYEVRWSPDGARLAFTGKPLLPAEDFLFRRREIWVTDTDGSNARALPAFTYHPPSWSPDSRTLAYACVEGCGIATVDIDGRGRQVLTTRFGDDYWPTWSRRGQIAFVREVGQTCCTRTVWVMDSDGSNQRQVSTARDVTFNLAWSE